MKHSNHSLFWFDKQFRSSGYWIDCEVLRYMSLMSRRAFADIRNKDQPVAGHGFMVAGFVQCSVTCPTGFFKTMLLTLNLFLCYPHRHHDHHSNG